MLSYFGSKYFVHGVRLDVADEGREEPSFWLKRLQKGVPSLALWCWQHHSLPPRPFPINYPFFSRVSLITAHEIFKLFSSQEAQMCWIPTLYQSVPKVAGRQGESLSQPPQTIFRTGQIISVHFRKEPFLIRRNDARHLYKYSVKKIWLVSDDMLVSLWGQNMMLQVTVKA